MSTVFQIFQAESTTFSIIDMKCQPELGNAMKHEVMNYHHFCQA